VDSSFWIDWSIVLVAGIGVGLRAHSSARKGAGIILSAAVLFVAAAVVIAMITGYSIVLLLALNLGVSGDPLYLSKAVVMGYILGISGLILIARKPTREGSPSVGRVGE